MINTTLSHFMRNAVNEDVQSLSLLFFPDSEAYKPGKSFSASGLSNSILFKTSIPLFPCNAFNDNRDTHDVDKSYNLKSVMCSPNCLITYCFQLVYKLAISCLTPTMYIHISADMFCILLIVLLGFMERNKIQTHNISHHLHLPTICNGVLLP